MWGEGWRRLATSVLNIRCAVAFARERLDARNRITFIAEPRRYHERRASGSGTGRAGGDWPALPCRLAGNAGPSSAAGRGGLSRRSILHRTGEAISGAAPRGLFRRQASGLRRLGGKHARPALHRAGRAKTGPL